MPNYKTLIGMNPSNTKNLSPLRLGKVLMALAVPGLDGGGPAQADVLLSLGTGSYWHHSQSVNGAVNQFLGRPQTGDTGDTGTNDSFGDRIDANADVRLRGHASAALTWQTAHPLSERLSVLTRLRFEYGQTSYFLKDGIGPLRDDITLRLAHISVTPSLALRHEISDAFTRGRIDLSLRAGLGVEMLWAKTRVTSALLNVRRTEGFADGIVFAGIDVALPTAPAAAVSLDVQWRNSIGPALRLGIGYAF